MKVKIPHPFNGPHFDGIKRVIQAVTAELSDDFDFEILTPEPSQMARDGLEGVEFDIFEKRLPGWGTDYYRRSVRRRLDGADLVWNHSFFFNSMVANSRPPSVFTYHSFRQNPQTRFPRGIPELAHVVRTRLMKRGFRYMCGNERVVCISDKSRDLVESRLKASTVRIHNGADYLGSGISDDDEGYIFWSDGIAHLPYVAKRVDYPIKLLSGPEELERFDSVEVINGTVSDDRMAELYRKCSFFVSNCFNEGFGIPPLEANFFGKPSIVIEKEVHDENFEDGVNGFRAANAAEMLEKIELLVDDASLRRELGKSAYEAVNDRFTWHRAAESYRQEFLSVIENR
ncbi:MAG: glycosyltransferase family 4 protein [Candidatus Nanohaloarchaea archaeon]